MHVTHVDVARRVSASSPSSRKPQEAEEMLGKGNQSEAQVSSSHIDGRKALLELRTAHQRQQHMRKGRTVQKWMEQTNTEPQSRENTLARKLVENETPGLEKTKGSEDQKAARRRRGEEIRSQMARRSAARRFEHEQQELSPEADARTKVVEHWIDVAQTHVSHARLSEPRESHPPQVTQQRQDEEHEELQQLHDWQQPLRTSAPATLQRVVGADVRAPARSVVVDTSLSCSLHACSCGVVAGLVYSLLRHSRVVSG